MRCGDCKHWGTERDVADGETFRTCVSVVHDKRGLVNTKDEQWEDDHEDREERDAFRATHKAVVQDGSGFRAALRCREDFGCVDFEPKAQ